MLKWNKIKFTQPTLEKCKEILGHADELIEHCKKDGWLLAEIAAFLNMSENRFYRCRQANPELADLVETCRSYSKAWWIKEGRDALGAGKFQGIIWISTMKNAFDWGDKPSERYFRAEEWEGGVEDKRKLADKWFREGKVTLEFHNHLMRSLFYHAQLNDIIYIQPYLKKMDLETKLENGEISQSEFDAEMELWEEGRRVREVAMKRMLEKEKIVSEYDTKHVRKTKKSEAEQ